MQAQQQMTAGFQVTVEKQGIERREHRRHDLEQQDLSVDRWEGSRAARPLGRLLDLSASGVRVRMPKANIRPDQQIRVRLKLPAYAGISPFVDRSADQVQPKREWVGWMTVARVAQIDGEQIDVAGRLVDMDEIDRGMLGLYLSTQPLAA
jgi:hypothetical protein